jgi:hypothetical protein
MNIGNKQNKSAQELLLGMLYTKANYTQVISLEQLVKFIAEKNNANAMGNFARASRDYLTGYLNAFDELIGSHAETVNVGQLEAYVKQVRVSQQKAVLPATRPEEWLECYDKIVRYAHGDDLVIATQSKTLEVHLRALSYNVDTVAYRVAVAAIERLWVGMNVDQRRALLPLYNFLKSLTVVVAVPPVLPPAS